MMQKLWIALCISIIAISFIISTAAPLYGDEGLYSISIKDIIKNGMQLYPTYFGEQMHWKPPLMFNLYALLIKPFYKAMPDEILLRMPSLIIMLISTCITYKLLEDDLPRNTIQYAILLYLVSLPVLGFSIRVLTDTLAFMFTVAAIYATKLHSIKPSLITAVGIGVFALLAGFSKSLIILLLCAALCITYYYFKARKLNAEIILALLAAIAIHTIIPYLFNMDYTILNVGDATRIDLSKMHRNFPYYLFGGGIPAIVSLIFCGRNILRGKIDFYSVWAGASLITLISSFSYLPWYLIYFTPAFGAVISRETENNIMDKAVIGLIIIATFATSLYLTYNVYVSYYLNEAEIIDISQSYKNDKIMVITKFGEAIASNMHDFPYFVMITPQNGFQGNPINYIVKEETLKEDNIKCLLYDYENDSCAPPPVRLLNSTERYFPPIGRTDKYWNGGFDVIFAEEPYAKAILKIAPEYNVEHITKNGRYYVLKK